MGSEMCIRDSLSISSIIYPAAKWGTSQKGGIYGTDAKGVNEGVVPQLRFTTQLRFTLHVFKYVIIIIPECTQKINYTCRMIYSLSALKNTYMVNNKSCYACHY